MGDLADDFRAMDEWKREQRAIKEPSRLEYATDALINAGHRVGIHPKEGNQALEIDGYITLWPFTGWWSGKGIGSGRGVHELIKKLAHPTKAIKE